MSDLELKPTSELERIETGTIVRLLVVNGNKTIYYTGIFRGVQGGRALMQSPYYPDNPTSIVRFKLSHTVGFEVKDNAKIEME